MGAEYVHRQHITARKNICAELLQRSEDDGDAFLSIAITRDEPRVHHFDPLTKRLSMEWHHQSSPRNKKNSRCRLLRV